MPPRTTRSAHNQKRKRPVSPPSDDSEPKRPRVASDEKEQAHESAESDTQEDMLSRPLLDSLASVIAQMASELPEDLSNIIGLGLPPDLAQEEENTLGHVLRRGNTTWNQLVDMLHSLSGQLSSTGHYPNPFPPRASFNIPPPPLLPHHTPDPIYAFCETLYSIARQTQPSDDATEGFSAERWALVQKPSQGDWFTGSVDLHEAAQLHKEDDEKSLMESMASNLETGYASVVALHSAIGNSSTEKQPTLEDSLTRRASMKMSRWKELGALRRKGGFGGIARGVRVHTLSNSSKSFLPTYGPAFDSFGATAGEGYYSTLEAMHERARYREWSERIELWSEDIDTTSWEGCRDTDTQEGEANSIDDIINKNGELIEELQTWLEVRAMKCAVKITEREQLVASQILASLTQVIHQTPPSVMRPKSASQIEWSHTLARRLISGKLPSLRGTLDPHRPHAVHDNTTLFPRDSAGPSNGAANGTSHPSAPLQVPPTLKTSNMPPPPSPHFIAPPPHTLPTSMPPFHSSPGSYSVPAPRAHPSYTSQSASQQRASPYPFASVTSTPVAHGHMRGVPPMPQSNAYLRTGPGPSHLRQAVGHESAGSTGAYGSTLS